MVENQMKTFCSYEDWFEEQPASLQSTICELSLLVKETAPELLRSSKWGNAVWIKGKLPLLFIHTKSDYLQFGFYAGSLLDDPYRLLEGKAKFVRHIPVFSNEIDRQTIAGLIQRAVEAKPYR